MKIIQASQKLAAVSESNAEWTCNIDGGLEIGPGTQISLYSALVHKPGSNLAAEVGNITVESDQNITLTAYLGFMANADPNRFVGLQDETGGTPVVDYIPRYAFNTASWDPIALKIPLQVPAGTYRPENLCSLLSEQSRLPYDLDAVPAGTILGPCVVDFDGVKNSVRGNVILNNIHLELAVLPPSATIMAHFAVGKLVEVFLQGGDEFTVTVTQAPNNDGDILVSQNLTEIPTEAICVTEDGALPWAFRTSAKVDTAEIVEGGVDGRSAFGCTTGLSFKYDSVTGKISLSMHSPLYDPSASATGQIVVGLDQTAGATPQRHFNGQGG